MSFSSSFSSKKEITNNILQYILDDNIDSLQKYFESHSYPIGFFSSDIYTVPRVLSYRPPWVSVAAFFGSNRCFDFLLGFQNNLNDKLGRSPIHFASMGGWIEIIKKLWNSKDCPDSNGDLPVLFAAMFGHIDSCDLLIDKMEPVSDLLSIASRFGHIKLVTHLVEYYHMPIMAQSNSQILSPFHEACLSGHTDIIEYFLSQGADYNSYSFDGKNAINYVVEGGSIIALRFLLKKGAKLSEDSIIEASKYGYIDIVNECIANGIFVDIEIKGQTPIYIAMYYKHPAIVDFLLHKGASIPQTAEFLQLVLKSEYFFVLEHIIVSTPILLDKIPSSDLFNMLLLKGQYEIIVQYLEAINSFDFDEYYMYSWYKQLIELELNDILGILINKWFNPKNTKGLFSFLVKRISQRKTIEISKNMESIVQDLLSHGVFLYDSSSKSETFFRVIESRSIYLLNSLKRIRPEFNLDLFFSKHFEKSWKILYSDTEFFEKAIQIINPECKSLKNQNMLHMLILSPSPKITSLKIILSRSIDTNLVDINGFTPLVLCCISKLYSFAYELLQHGADPSIKDPNGLYPIEIMAKDDNSLFLFHYMVSMNIPLGKAFEIADENNAKFLLNVITPSNNWSSLFIKFCFQCFKK